MIRVVPAGWLSTQDVMSKLANIFFEAAAETRPGSLDFATANVLAAAYASELMQRLRPPLGAFISLNGEHYMVPATVWGLLLDAHMIDPTNSDLIQTFKTGDAVGTYFGQYRGEQVLFGYQNVTSLVAQMVQALKLGHEISSLGAPWERFGNPTAWLKSGDATRFANERLRKSGLGETEKNRRAEFAKVIISEHRYSFTERSIESIRNGSGYRIRG